MTQGRCDGREWVTSFKISYSHDAFHWKYVNDAYDNHRLFEGNIDSCSVRHSYIDKPVIGRFLRFHTISWKGHPSMRVEILGCQPCKQPLALPPYAKTTASSESSPNKRNSPSISGTAQDSYLLTKGAWCAQKSDKQPWLQIDVGPPTILTAVSTKGLGEFRKKRWVTHFNISYANSTTGPWYNYSESGNDYSFTANTDKYTERRHYFASPFKARFIRFYPTKWKGKQPCMRAGVFGCPQNGICQKGYLRVAEDSPCVENIAYGRKSYVNNKRHFKRHVGEWSGSNQAQRAVDGDENQSIHHCTILDNFYVSRPFWMVDLGHSTPISGVVIVTWQGKNLKTNSPVKSSYYDYMRNLRKLTVYVSSEKRRSKKVEKIAKESNKCGYVTSVNEALFQRRIHIECMKPMNGRYLYIEAEGAEDRWSKVFSAVLCEVMAYS
ncbi:DgyrCDS1858 [Dimorphilus gyrociliatus]|nr:DgyrCDS1858 [Dimorphilus gyrociliatus]